jgi:hypothetical protein
VGHPERRDDAHRLAVRLVTEAEPYYVSARWGMARLPFRSAWAVGRRGGSTARSAASWCARARAPGTSGCRPRGARSSRRCSGARARRAGRGRSIASGGPRRARVVDPPGPRLRRGRRRPEPRP